MDPIIIHVPEAPVTMPIMAGLISRGDPWEKELDRQADRLADRLADLVAQKVFGTDMAAARRWSAVLG